VHCPFEQSAKAGTAATMSTRASRYLIIGERISVGVYCTARWGSRNGREFERD
jgi:hypothetical protein